MARTSVEKLVERLRSEGVPIPEEYRFHLIWQLDKVPSLLSKDITTKVETWLSARAIQAAGKQASGIVRGTRTKQKRRQFIYEQLLERKHYKRARKLKTGISNDVGTVEEYCQ